MQDPNNSQSRNKPWYQRAIEMGSYGEALAIIPSPHKFQRQLHPRY
ncbi:hypothetical protein ACFX13_025481 [Malus domestica]